MVAGGAVVKGAAAPARLGKEIFLLYTCAVFGYNKVSIYAKEAGTG